MTFKELSDSLGYDHPIRLATDLMHKGLPLHRKSWQHLYPRTELEPVFAQLIREYVQSH